MGRRDSLTHPVPYLVTASDVRQGLVPEPARPYRDALEEVVRWADEYLLEPHPDLGRSGPVCPYVRPSLDRDLLWLTVHPGVDPPLDGLMTAAEQYRRWFHRLPPRSGHLATYKALLILLPDLPPERGPDCIDVVQKALKPRFVADGLMLGQFYPGCSAPGLWNHHFRPLSSTVPLLTIRHMVAADAGFLVDAPGHLAAYFAHFGDAIPGHLLGAIQDAARRLGVDVPRTQSADDASRAHTQGRVQETDARDPHEREVGSGAVGDRHGRYSVEQR